MREPMLTVRSAELRGWIDERSEHAMSRVLHRVNESSKRKTSPESFHATWRVSCAACPSIGRTAYGIVLCAAWG